MLASGGAPNLTGSCTGVPSNTAIAMTALLGECGSLSPSTQLTVDELTTVGTAYALNQFADGSGQNMGAPLSNTIGLSNAAKLATTNLVTTATGGPASFLPTSAQCSQASPPANCTTLMQMDTLANILAACVNSSGPQPPYTSDACSVLFSNTGSTQPFTSVTTLQAIHSIARAPGQNVSAIFGIQGPPATAPYQPALNVVPNDWTLSLSYTGGGLNNPFGIAVDSAGNIWVANNNANTISQFSSVGSPVVPTGYTGGGLTNPFLLAIDTLGNVWATNNQVNSSGPASSNSISVLDASGSPAFGSPFSAVGGLSSPIGIAVDSKGLIWIANNDTGVTELCGATTANCGSGMQTGQAISPSGGYTGGGENNSAGLAIDGQGLIWVTNNGSGGGIGSSISEFCGSIISNCGAVTQTGLPISGSSGYAANVLKQPIFSDIDPSQQVWVADVGDNRMVILDSAGSETGFSPVTGVGGLAGPIFVKADSLGDIWISNLGSSAITELSPTGSALSPSTGFVGAGLNTPGAIAIDPSGDLWVSNTSIFSPSTDEIAEFVGIAGPVMTPQIGPPTVP